MVILQSLKLNMIFYDCFRLETSEQKSAHLDGCCLLLRITTFFCFLVFIDIIHIYCQSTLNSSTFELWWCLISFFTYSICVSPKNIYVAWTDITFRLKFSRLKFELFLQLFLLTFRWENSLVFVNFQCLQKEQLCLTLVSLCNKKEKRAHFFPLSLGLPPFLLPYSFFSVWHAKAGGWRGARIDNSKQSMVFCAYYCFTNFLFSTQRKLHWSLYVHK